MNTKLSLALAAIALLPALSLAADPAETVVVGKQPVPSAVVRFGDLDLSTPKGAQIFRARLDDAAWQVCEQVLDRPVSIDGSKCVHVLVEDAQQRVLGH
jgi:UrcA family protein